MTEIKEMCPSCKSPFELILNPENISGDSICICSNCLTFIVAENGKLRKMTYEEICIHYLELKQRCILENSDVLVVKFKWVRQAMRRMLMEQAALN